MGSIIQDYVRIAETIGAGGRFAVALNELVSVQEAARLGVPVTVADSVGIAWALGATQGATVAEKLGISAVLDYPVKLNYTIAETLRLLDVLSRFLHVEVSEAITAQDTMAALARHIAAVSENVTLSETLTPHFILSVEVHDEAIFSDDFDLKMIFQPEIREQIVISALYVSPDGGVTAWTVNTRTGAVTEYENYEFTSFAQHDIHYLGATGDGLYVLDGDDDVGQPTIAHLRSGFAQFGGSRFVSFKAAYLGIRGDGQIFLKLDTGDGRAYTYRAVIQNQQSTKVRFGKGLRARYFAFELITEGQDFDLDTIEFVPVVAQRRV